MSTGFCWAMTINNEDEDDNSNGIKLQRLKYETKKRPFAAMSQIACRICDKVFNSPRDLVNHLKSHQVENVDCLSQIRQQHDDPNHNVSQIIANHRFSNSLHQNFPSTTPSQTPITTTYLNTQALQERTNHFLGTNPQLGASASVSRSQFSSPMADCFCVGSHVPVVQSRFPSLTANHFSLNPHMSPHLGPLLKMQRRAVIGSQVNDITKPFLDQLQFKPAESGPKRDHHSETPDLTLKL